MGHHPRPVRRALTVPAPINLLPSQSFDGADGKWSTFTVGVGTPPQNFRVLPSTQIGETWVISTKGCTSTDPSDCYAQRGGETFNGSPSKGFVSDQSSTWNEIGLYGLQAELSLNITGNGQFGTDVVSLNGGNASSTGSGVSLPAELVAAVPDKNYFLGYLGLSLRPSQFTSAANSKNPLLQDLFEANLIPGTSFAYTAGAYYGDNGKQNYASLVLGGYDTTRFNADKSLSLSFGQKDARQLLVGVQSITVSDSLNGTASMTAGTSGHLSLIDSTVSELWLPASVCDQIASSFGLFLDVNTDRYIINSTMHGKWNASNPTFTFKLGQTAYDNGKGINIVLPYSAFDFTLGWPIYSQQVYYFPMRRAANDSQYVLGRTLLQQAYIIVDYERKNFTVAAATFPDTTLSPNIVPVLSPNRKGSGRSSLGAGAIAGIVIGAVAALIIAIGLFLWLRRKKQSKGSKAKIAELDARDSTFDPSYHKIQQDGVQEAGGSEVQELPGAGIGGYKTAQSAELETPAPVYEMEGDHYLNPGSARSPQISSPGTSQYSPGRPSPAAASPSDQSPIKSPYSQPSPLSR